MVRRTALLRALVALTALWSAACAATLMKLPAGPGTAAPDAVDALTQAASACRGIQTLTAEIAVSGSAGGQRVRGRLLAGVAAPASARIEALAPFGAPVFMFVATNDDATLLLPRDDRVLEHGRPEAVLDGVAGVPLSGADLHTTLSGCAPAIAEPQGRALGSEWRVVTGSADGAGPVNYALYLRRDSAAARWRLVVVIREETSGGWRTEYRDFQNDLPRTIRVTSGGARPREAAFDLTMTLSQVETNVPLGPDVFRLEIPLPAAPITLEELRRARLGLREN